MDRRRYRGRENGQRADDLNSNDLKFNVDFETRTISHNKDWNGRIPSGPPPPYSEGGYDKEDLDSGRRPGRSGPHKGPRGGPGMTRRGDVETDEAGMDDFINDFEDMGMDPRGYSTPGGPQGRRGMGRRRLDDMDGFDEEDMDPHGPSTRSGPHGRGGLGSRQFDEDDIDPRGPSTQSRPQGRAGMGRRHLDDMGGFDDEDIDPRRPSMRSGPQGRRGSGPDHMDGPTTNMTPPAPGGSRVPRSQPAKPKPSLRELEAELDKVEREKERAMRMANRSYGSSKQGRDLNKTEQLVFRIMELKMEIYKIDPQSKRIDNAARFFLHLPAKSNGNQEPGGPRPSRRGPVPRGSAPRGGGNYGRQRGRPCNARDDRY